MCDFASDVPFAQTMDKLVEHYGVLLGEGVIRRITLKHAENIHNEALPPPEGRELEGEDFIIAEMDGGMVPIVEPDEGQADKRKGKTLFWKEAKLGLAHALGSTTLHYGGTLEQDVDLAGKELLACTVRAGLGKRSHLHAVGDGAPWIANQVEEQFGSQGHYLLDFYHVCEYLEAAGKAIHSTGSMRTMWMNAQKVHLKSGRYQAVLEALKPYQEPDTTPDESAPVRCGFRYLSKRTHQLDYAHAIEHELPIGSGEIESAHRYVVQQRLKRPGAWWRLDSAQLMLSLRLNRANRQWYAYWVKARGIAA